MGCLNMDEHNFYAKYYLIKNNPPELTKYNIRVSFYVNETKVGQAIIEEFDASSCYLESFKIYKKYRHKGYGTEAMQFLLTRFNIAWTSIDVTNDYACRFLGKFNFIIEDIIYETFNTLYTIFPEKISNCGNNYWLHYIGPDCMR